MARFTKEEANALGDLLFYAGKNADEDDAKLYATIADKIDELLIEEGYLGAEVCDECGSVHDEPENSEMTIKVEDDE
jgi:hypothetical protein